ncbi:MAG: hypothetical protein FD175_174 [Beijerinckiaceae bacterium]|nr:MAG: hypothetical protein FD175_174 [Beijerinckiaceae bacterium]
MTVNRPFFNRDLDAAVEAGVLDLPAAERLRGFLAARAPQPVEAQIPVPVLRPKFDLTHLLWYAGALIIMSAMGLFSTLAFAAMGGGALAVTGLIYGLGLWYAGHRLWKNEETRTPGGLLIAVAVAMVPLIVFGIQSATKSWAGYADPGKYQGFYHYVKGGWLPMEVATIIASILAIRRYPFAFIAFPAAVCLWFMSMDIAAHIAGDRNFSYELRRRVTLYFGMALFVATWIYELRPRKADYAFWLHLVAALSFWGGLTFQSSTWEFGKFLYCMINVALIGVSLFVGRRVYTVFGVIGVMTYLGHLAYSVFKDSMLFPFALSAFGLGMVALGIFFARRRSALEAAMETWLPPGLAHLRPYPARSERI